MASTGGKRRTGGTRGAGSGPGAGARAKTGHGAAGGRRSARGSGPKAGRTLDVSAAVRQLCLSFPEAEEVQSHGSPDFRVEGKTFATYTINHHGDGHVALWLRSPPGAQQLYTEMEPEYYFVPAYVGTKGWLGVELNTGIPWETVAKRAREAYEEVAPGRLHEGIDSSLEIPGAVRPLTAEEIDPFQRARAREVLEPLGAFCLSLPETGPATQFGNPVWKAGKKTFLSTHHRRGRLQLEFRVGPERQAMLTLDPRFTIPAYTGHNGWIALDVEDHADWQEIESLALESYRHFALKRMLKTLDGA